MSHHCLISNANPVGPLSGRLRRNAAQEALQEIATGDHTGPIRPQQNGIFLDDAISRSGPVETELLHYFPEWFLAIADHHRPVAIVIGVRRIIGEESMPQKPDPASGNR